MKKSAIFTVAVCSLAMACTGERTSAPYTEFTAVPSEAPSLLPAGREFRLVWNDEFNGNTLDTTKWRYRTSFWGKDAWWYAKPQDNAVEVKDGMVHLKLTRREDGQLVTPQLQTGNLIWDYIQMEDRKSFWPLDRLERPLFMHRYGYYECRCRLQQMPGWWSAFWMQSPSQGTSTDPAYAGVEQDIVESFDPGEILCSVFHYNGYGRDHVQFTSPRSGEKALLDKTVFHTFGLLWEPDGYTAYVDGIPRGEKLGSQEKEAVSHIPEFILVTTECKWYRNGDRSCDSLLEKAYAAGDAFIVDYVRVYDIADLGFDE